MQQPLVSRVPPSNVRVTLLSYGPTLIDTTSRDRLMAFRTRIIFAGRRRLALERSGTRGRQ
jgi:hypothetical protein